MKRFWAYLIAGAVFFNVVVCIANTSGQRPRLIVGGDHNFPPFEFSENGEPSGYNIELIRAVADIVHLDIEIRLGPWSLIMQDLQERKIDIITGMVFSEERGKYFDFTVPHTMISPGLFVRNDSPITDLDDISGKEIIVQQDDIMHEFLKRGALNARIITVPTLPDALRLLSSGNHDGALLSSEMHKYYVEGKLGFDNLKEVRLDLTSLNYCFAVAEGNRALLHKLDQGLIILKSTGDYQKIYQKWFGVYEKKEWWDTIKYFVLALVLVAGFFIISLLWSWSLKKRVDSKTLEIRVNEEELRRAHGELENRVAERTADLALVNEKLQSEIIEREKVEDALRNSEAEYRAMVEAFDGQIYICSSDYRIEFMNQKLIDRTGYDATGELCYRVLHDRDSICPWCVNDRILNGETVSWEIESPKDNRWYYTVNTPINHGDGTISKQAMIQDITERVEAEQEKQKLESLHRQLQKVESLDRMAGAIAHHFNNKLHVVMGHLDLAAKSTSGNEGNRVHLTNALEAAEQAVEVSRLMLTYLGKVSGSQAPLDLSEICARGLLLIEKSVPHNVILTTEFESPGPPIVANANQIHLILSNMIKNSWEAIGENNGSIHLTVGYVEPDDIPVSHRFPVNWQPDGNQYGCLEVCDTGCGIKQKDIDAAFDPFFSTKFTGRGLGLSVVLGLVQAHSGVATVESSLDEGSVFKIYFPVSEQKIAPVEERVKSTFFPEGGTVLLVDDDKIVMHITAEMLSLLGFTVLRAKDGVEGVEVYRKHQQEIHFVLSDFAMPKMNGMEMLAMMRRLDPDIAIIIASGYSEEQVMDVRHQERPDIFMEKPFGVNELKDAIGIALAKKQRSAAAEKSDTKR